MNEWTPRSRFVVGVILVSVSGVAAATSSGDPVSFGSVLAFVGICLAIVGLVLGTLRLYRRCDGRTRAGMRASLAIGMLLSAVGVAQASGGRGVGFVAEALIAVAVVDGFVLMLTWIRRR